MNITKENLVRHTVTINGNTIYITATRELTEEELFKEVQNRVLAVIIHEKEFWFYENKKDCMSFMFSLDYHEFSCLKDRECDQIEGELAKKVFSQYKNEI